MTKTVSNRDAATEATGMYSRRAVVNLSISCTKPIPIDVGCGKYPSGYLGTRNTYGLRCRCR